MAYNSKQHLTDNIEAVETAFICERRALPATARQLELLNKYSGFGGLKCVIMPFKNDSDLKNWSKADLSLFPLVKQLHEVIRENSTSEKEYQGYIQSMKESVLTSFFTPKEVTNAIADVLKNNDIRPSRILEPSAGTGNFITPVKSFQPNAEIHAFEKDLLTGKVLKALFPDDNIRVNGFEEISPGYENYFDMVISNIPFGNYSVFDEQFMRKNDREKLESCKSIHNYFFVKSVDCLREGGMLAFITSQGVMDSPKNEPIRQYLMRNTHLISAIRLPNNLMAENANTEAGSDLVVLQKNTQKAGNNDVEQEFEKVKTLSNDIKINHLFLDLKRVSHTQGFADKGLYGDPAMTFLHQQGAEGVAADIKAMLGEDISNRFDQALYLQHQKELIHTPPQVSKPVEIKPLHVAAPEIKQDTQTVSQTIKSPELKPSNPPAVRQAVPRAPVKTGKRKKAVSDPYQLDIFSQPAPEEPATIQKNNPREEQDSLATRIYSGEIQSFYRNGTLVTDGNQIGYIRNLYKDSRVVDFEPLNIWIGDKQRLAEYINVRDAYYHLFYYEAQQKEENSKLRQKFNEAYDKFLWRYGNLNSKPNADPILMDATGRDILSLERFHDGKKQLADIFQKPVSFSREEYLSVETANEALAASLNKYGHVELDYMRAIIDKTEDELIRELKGRIFYNPITKSYEYKDKFLAGNVIKKIKDITSHIDAHSGNPPNKEFIEEALEALNEVKPQRISFEEIDFNLGERWIGDEIFSNYASDLFETTVNIKYNPPLDDFEIKCNSSNTIINEKYAVRSQSQLFSGVRLLHNALVNTTPRITKTIQADGEEVTVPDAEATQLAASIIDELRNGFSDWLRERPVAFQNKIEQRYNDTFNCFVKPEYDGSFQTFPDLQLQNIGIEALRESQKNAIWMIKQNGGGICDHEVLRP